MYIAENEAILRNVLAAYDFPDTPIGVVRYGSGQVTYVEPCSAAYAVFGELLFNGVISLLEELFGGFLGNSGSDENVNTCGNHHKSEANSKKNFAVGFFKECENKNG